MDACVKVSVIIPFCNRFVELNRAIKSVLAQDYKNLEILLVDDYSAERYLEKFLPPDPRIRVLANSKNKGGGGARNTGIEAAVGEVVAFLDSDDEWLRERVSAGLRLQSTISEKRGRWLQYTSTIVRENAREVILPRRKIQKGERVADYLMRGRGFIQTSGLFMPTKVAREIRFDESLSRLQDWDFYLRAERREVSFVYCDQPLVVHYGGARSGRVSSAVDWQWLKKWVDDRRECVGRRAYLSFLATRVSQDAVVGGRRLLGLYFLVVGAMGFGLGPRSLAPYILRALLPESFFEKLVEMNHKRGRA